MSGEGKLDRHAQTKRWACSLCRKLGDRAEPERCGAYPTCGEFYVPTSEVERLEHKCAQEEARANGMRDLWYEAGRRGDKAKAEVERLREALERLVGFSEGARAHVTQMVVSPTEALPTGGITEVCQDSPSEVGVSVLRDAALHSDEES